MRIFKPFVIIGGIAALLVFLLSKHHLSAANSLMPVRVLDSLPSGVLPAFSGGINALNTALAGKFQYPANSTEEGLVRLRLHIDASGNLRSVMIEKGINVTCDHALVEALKSLNGWIPGNIEGRNTDMPLRLPILINDEKAEVDEAELALLAPKPDFFYKLIIDPTGSDGDVIYPSELVRASFPGGESAFDAFLAANLKYPEANLKNRLVERVEVGFIVEKDGSITHSGSRMNANPEMYKEALRLVYLMPKWQPAVLNGAPVHTVNHLSIYFDPDGKLHPPADIQPTFPGGKKALASYLTINQKYPESARQYDISGEVEVSFYVELDGSITGIDITEGLGYGCDDEAIRLVSKMPKWIPGKVMGTTKRMIVNMRIQF
jgi:TonB family protein